MAYIGDKVGRKIALLLLSMALAMNWIILLCSLETWALIFARSLVGVTMAGCFVTCPVYTKKISNDTIRGALGCLMASFTQLVVIISMVTTSMQGARIRRDTTLDLSPTPGNANCTTKKGTPGICVDYSVCNDDYMVISTGILAPEDEFRGKKQCGNNWCCTTESVIPPPEIGNTRSDKCLAPKSDVCPWCVLLYNAVDKKTAHRPFCLGALIGSRVIIAAATCIVAAQRKILYAQVPNSANPGKNYTINRRQFNPNYDSGSHAYDFGVMVLDNDVTFKEKARGACIDFANLSKPVDDRCVAYGFDDTGRLTSTIMEVQNKSCGKRGNSTDAVCGASQKNEVCIVVGGGPVLCERGVNEDNGLYLIGIARSTCNKNNQVILGSIAHSKQWIEAELASMKIDKDVYNKYIQLNL